MNVFLILLLLALIFAGAGAAIHLLWIVAVIFLILWIVSFFVNSTRTRL